MLIYNRNKLDTETISYIAKFSLRSQLEKLQKDITALKGKILLAKSDETIKELLMVRLTSTFDVFHKKNRSTVFFRKSNMHGRSRKPWQYLALV